MLHLSPQNKAQPYSLDMLTETHLFQSMPQDIATALAGMASVIELDKNETLYMQHDAVEWFYLVLSGWVKVYRETQDGDEAVIELAGEGDFVGEFTFGAEQYHNSNASAADRAIVMRLPASLLERAVTASHQTALEVISFLAHKRQKQSQEVESLKLQNAPQRIGCFMLRQCDGKDEGSHELTLPYCKSLIATQLGMKGETFSRALTKLRQSTDTSVKSNQVTVPNIQKLADFVCTGCSRVYSE